MNNFLLFITSFLISFAAGVIVFFFSYSIIITIMPAVTDDGLHHVMPIGQVFLSFIIAVIIGLIIWWFSYKKLVKKYNAKKDK